MNSVWKYQGGNICEQKNGWWKGINTVTTSIQREGLNIDVHVTKSLSAKGNIMCW